MPNYILSLHVVITIQYFKKLFFLLKTKKNQNKYNKNNYYNAL